MRVMFTSAKGTNTDVRRHLPLAVIASVVGLAVGGSLAPPAHAGDAAPVVNRVRTDDHVVFITIDDGWVRDRRVTDLVHREHLPVTVFLIQKAGQEDPAYFRDVASEGGSVQDHTFDHPHLSRLSRDRQSGEICPPMDWEENTFNHRPTLLRPPYGDYNRTTTEVAGDCGLHDVVTWSAEVKGTKLTYGSGHSLHPGDIVLFHFHNDLYDGLSRFIETARQQGFTFGRLEDYLVPPPPPPPPPPQQQGPLPPLPL
jgi:peptidoglycan/xylan/chitin deacetylase (PgdA/CDA1 family)